MGAGRYSGELASWFLKRGHEVRAIATPSYQPDWRALGSGRGHWRWRRESVGDVSVLRCPALLPRRPRRVSRFLHHASFALTSAPALLAETLSFKPNLVLSMTPALMAAPAALLAARAAGAPAWLHLQRFETGAVRSDIEDDTFGTRNKPPLAQQAERAIFGRFDMVSAPSEDLQDQLAERGVPLRRQLMLPNWVDSRRIYPMRDPSTLRAALNLGPGDFVALCMGPSSEDRSIDALIEAASLVPERGMITFVLCGSDKAWKRIKRAGRPPRLLFLPLHHAADLNELLNLADVHLIWPQGDPTAPEVPGEFGTLLASGRPLIAAADPQSTLARIIQPVGMSVSPEGGGLAAAVIQLAASPIDQLRYGRAARQWALDYYEKERVLRRLEIDLYDRFAWRLPGLQGAQ